MVDGAKNSFNHSLGIALTLIAREWVKVDGAVQAELKRLLSKVPVPLKGLTDKNKRFLRQFDDVNTLRRLVQLPERLWAEVKRETRPTYRTLAKTHAALAIGILIYMPIRPQNLLTLEFETHLFIRTGQEAKSTLELSSGEVKNNIDLAFEIPPMSSRGWSSIGTASRRKSLANVRRGYSSTSTVRRREAKVSEP